MLFVGMGDLADRQKTSGLPLVRVGDDVGGKCKVAWPSVCRPTELGGLGILDLRFFGFALRLRWEWLRRYEPGRCWASLPARTEKPVAVMSAISMITTVGDGSSALLWTDS